MRLYELNRDGGLLLDAIRRARAREAPRTGLHVSTICDDIFKTVYPAIYRSTINEHNTLAFQELGNAFEDVLARELRRRVPDWIKPHARCDADGIIGSPDGYRPHARAIDEIKATWTTEGNPHGKHPEKAFVITDRQGRIIQEAPKFWRYRLQAMKYADMWDCDRVHFHICFINGNWMPPFPNFRTLTLVFTRAERQANSDYLRQHAIDRRWLKAA